LRFTPTPFHDDQMIDDLVRAMNGLWTRCNVKRHGLAA
jgi:5-aminolevulinate synthase